MLNNCYQKTLNGINKISPPIEKFANDYLEKTGDKEKAVKDMMALI